MELSSLYLTRNMYSMNKEISGTIEFVGPAGKVSLQLTPDNCRDILKVIASRLVEQSKEIAANMTADIINSVSALENKE